MRIWLIFDPRRALIGLFAFLLVLALLIHFILLGTTRYNWLDRGAAATPATVAYPAASAPVTTTLRLLVILSPPAPGQRSASGMFPGPRGERFLRG